MIQTRQLRFRKVVLVTPTVAAILVALLAALDLIGWGLGIELFKSWLQAQRVAMNPATAIALLIGGASLWLIRYEPVARWKQIAARILSATMIFIAIARLTAYATHSRIAIDQFVFGSRLADNAMSPNSAIALLLIGTGIFFLDFATREKFHPAQALIITGGCIGLLSATGYLYSAERMYALHGFEAMALNTSVSLIALSLGILCSRPEREPFTTLLSDTLGGVVARRLVPAVFVVPLAIGKLELLGLNFGLYDRAFGLALLVIGDILVFNLLIWWCAGGMRASDLRRRITEDVLRESGERNRAILQQAAEGIYLVDLESKRIIDSNAAIETLLGYAPGELDSMQVYDVVADTPQNIDARLEQLIKADAAMVGRRQYRRKDGSLIDVESSAVIISYGGRRVACTVAHDVTARMRAEEMLRASEARLRQIIETANDAFLAMDSAGRIIDWNPQAQATFGWSREDVLGRLISQTVIPERFRTLHEQGLQIFLTTGQGPVLGRRIEMSALHRDGREFPVELTISPARIGEERIFFSFIHDISARKHAEEERDRFFTLSSDLVAVAGFDGYFKRVNPAFEATLGYSADEMLAKPWLFFVHPDDREATVGAKEKLTGGARVFSFENRYRCKDGSYKWIDWTSVPVVSEQLIYCIGRDMTEAKQFQAELKETIRSERDAIERLKSAQSALVQSEKLAGLGQMVAGVAHEINNPLSFVTNNVAVLQRDIRGLSELLALYEQADASLGEHNAELLQQIRQLSERIDLSYTKANIAELLDRSREGLRRIQQIVRDLRDFARLDQSDLQETDINAGIESTVNIVRGAARRKHVEVELRLGALPLVAVYPAKINQVVMNLIANAIDAVKDGGRVIVQTEAEERHVRITVIDNGPGVPEEIRDRIFDPFFTTKPIGEGTGLGLSISYGIVQDHGGTMQVSDAPGGGARFDVRIPLQPPQRKR